MKSFTTIIAVVIALLSTSCEDNLRDYYNEREYSLTGFNAVQLGDNLRTEFYYSEEFKVMAKGEDGDLEDLEFRVLNKTLTASYTGNRTNRKRTLVQIYMPALKEAVFHSATSTSIKGLNPEKDSLKLTVSSASYLVMENIMKDWKYLEVEVTGASHAILFGYADEIKANISGASELSASALETPELLIQVNRLSEAIIRVGRKLFGAVGGRSKLAYEGNPSELQVEVTGDSELVRQNQ